MQAHAAAVGATPIVCWQPRERGGKFREFLGGGLLIDSHGRQVLGPILEKSCELLPMLPYGRETFYVVNVVECVDCLDEASTEWRTSGESGVRYGINKYEFSKVRFSDSSLFKIPKSPEIMVVSGLAEAESDFKSIVERNGLTGLKFQELWSAN